MVTQVKPPGKSSVAWGRQTGDTVADSWAGVASLIRAMSLRMVRKLNLGFLKTWSRWQHSQWPHPWPGHWGLYRDCGDCWGPQGIALWVLVL